MADLVLPSPGWVDKDPNHGSTPSPPRHVETTKMCLSTLYPRGDRVPFREHPYLSLSPFVHCVTCAHRRGTDSCTL